MPKMKWAVKWLMPKRLVEQKKSKAHELVGLEVRKPQKIMTELMGLAHVDHPDGLG
jgi:hypothetical protein